MHFSETGCSEMQWPCKHGVIGPYGVYYSCPFVCPSDGLKPRSETHKKNLKFERLQQLHFLAEKSRGPTEISNRRRSIAESVIAL